MKKARVLNIFSLVFNVLTMFTFVFVGVITNEIQLTSQMQYIEVSAAVFFTIIAAICVAFNIIGIVKNKKLPKSIYGFKLMATVATSMSLVYFFIIKGYQCHFDMNLMLGEFKYNNPVLYLNIVIPALAIIGFALFDHTEEAHFPINFFSMIPVGIFSITYILNIYFQLVPFDGVYDYYYFSDIFSYGTLIIPLALIVLS